MKTLALLAYGVMGIAMVFAIVYTMVYIALGQDPITLVQTRLAGIL